ncbi:MAG: outer membrane beta-barrel protein, partial [Rhodospirillales bacterium]|nr:outer membrane beta-barrel protein [Rhodospirillales bacterium]
GLNFGQLFTDHANQAQLNQLLLTAAKPLDPTNPDFQWGFKLQFMYGSDARYTQFLGELNRVTPDSRYQLDVVEANALFHLPVLTDGGIDVKAGQYSTPIGYETIDPSTNPFYSHSYIFQFGLPFKHTGVLTTTHVNETLDIYGGLDTGANTTFGPLGENNSAIGGIVGFGLNGLAGGKLTILALTHLGPEQASRVLSPAGINANGQWRYFNDIVITYKDDVATLDPAIGYDWQNWSMIKSLFDGVANSGATTTTSSSRPSPTTAIRSASSRVCRRSAASMRRRAAARPMARSPWASPGSRRCRRRSSAWRCGRRCAGITPTRRTGRSTRTRRPTPKAPRTASPSAPTWC